MPKTYTALRIFVASPSDVADERQLLESVVNELNLLWSEQLNITLDLIRWETHSFPSVSTDAQSVINEQIGDDFDIFVGILWTRFGTATPRAASGTLEEFERAYKRWKQDPNSIRIMFYFKNSQISPDHLDGAQLTKVHEFRKTLPDNGVLYWTFDTPESFSTFLRIHLSRAVQDWKKKVDSVGQLQKQAEAPEVRSQVGTPTISQTMAENSEDGVLDLLETVTLGSQRVNETIHRIGGALNSLTTKIREVTPQFTIAKGDEENKRTRFKRAAVRAAHVMNDFVALMKTEVPIMSASLSEMLDAYGKTISLLGEANLDFDTTPILENALDGLISLQEGMLGSQDSVARLRNTVSRLPPATNFFNQSKRNMTAVLDQYIEAIESASNVLPEIQKSIMQLLDDQKGRE